MFDALDFVFDIARRRLNHDFITLCLAHHRTCNWRTHRDFALADVGLVVAYDLVGDRRLCVEVDHLHCRAKDYFAGWLDLRHVDNLRACKLTFDLCYTSLAETLLLARRVVFGILFEIAVLSRLCNGLCDSGTLYPFKPL